jgi:hypothetical protein
VKADRDVTPADRARFNLVFVGAPPLNALAPPMPAKQPDLGDDAYRAIAPDSQAPGRASLTFGALTPRGFERLRQFAVPNQDHIAPEPNLEYVRLH